MYLFLAGVIIGFILAIIWFWKKFLKERAFYESRILKFEEYIQKWKDKNDNLENNIASLTAEKRLTKVWAPLSVEAIDTSLLLAHFDSSFILYRVLHNGSFTKIATLDFKVTHTLLFIIDITGEENQGYGSILMNELLSFARERNVPEIRGELSFIDLQSHKERLLHFYRKHGFNILSTEQGDEYGIQRKV